MLAVVDDEQELLVGEEACYAPDPGAPCQRKPKRGSDHLRHLRGVDDRSQLYEENAVPELVDEFGGDGDRESCLAAPARSRQCHQPMSMNHLDDAPKLGITSEQRGGLRRQVMTAQVERPQGRKLILQSVGHRLKDAFGFRQIPQAPLHRDREADDRATSVRSLLNTGSDHRGRHS